MLTPEQKESQIVETYYGLPAQVRYCTKCTISNQRPNSVVEFKNRPGDSKATIDFDEYGVCSACRYNELKTTINWKAREEALLALCEKHRRHDGAYDCIVPGSGGKDSAFTSHLLKYKYGMNPLTVTWAPHKYTPIGWQNFQNWIHAGLDNILYSPNGRLHRLLTRLAFENLCHPFQPFIIGQRHVGPRFAAMYGIPLIFYGENQAEYGNNISENEKPTMDPSFYTSTRDLDGLYLGGVPAEALLREHQVDLRDLNPYLPPDGSALEQLGAEVHYLGYYVRWDPQECFYYASEHTGFSPNTERTEGSYSKYSSIDDRIDPLHYYTTLIKFGIGRTTYDSSQEVRNEKITREEGVALVRQFDCEFPAKYFNEILEYMDITEKRFGEIIEKFRSPHLWCRVGDQWKLKHPIE